MPGSVAFPAVTAQPGHGQDDSPRSGARVTVQPCYSPGARGPGGLGAQGPGGRVGEGGGFLAMRLRGADGTADPVGRGGSGAWILASGAVPAVRSRSAPMEVIACSNPLDSTWPITS